ncbi:MAG: hypothetical protein ACK4PR_00715 [Gammaproteobacteria bacterium]
MDRASKRSQQEIEADFNECLDIIFVGKVNQFECLLKEKPYLLTEETQKGSLLHLLVMCANAYSKVVNQLFCYQDSYIAFYAKNHFQLDIKYVNRLSNILDKYWKYYDRFYSAVEILLTFCPEIRPIEGKFPSDLVTSHTEDLKPLLLQAERQSVIKYHSAKEDVMQPVEQISRKRAVSSSVLFDPTFTSQMAKKDIMQLQKGVQISRKQGVSAVLFDPTFLPPPRSQSCSPSITISNNLRYSRDG